MEDPEHPIQNPKSDLPSINEPGPYVPPVASEPEKASVVPAKKAAKDDGDPDALEDEIDAAEDDGDVEVRHGRLPSPKRKK